ncbi:hypothetical protein QBC34DRAFT_122280 [Podospora aff. communis PSN243]|uniref:Cellobiose dehydrogenase-like cytochrome domain-containing protein n=1 Tax=Podospora aff. communis PSN243 TaxID=3040156 RepID=A0AAV9GID9_9PEZI|nr:hypothetical protein QBC34DRAFT_122280 [Podospora aff. communis PSN243]
MRLLTALAVAATATAQTSTVTSEYVDPITGFTFQSYATNSYRFGLILPSSNPATDLIAQIVGPLNTDGDGWVGIDFGSSMIGPLLLVAWPTGDPSSPVIASPRQAHGKSPDLVHVYDNHQVEASLIPKGTFVNTTHITATILCRGCVNSDSFDPLSDSGQFGYAYSVRSVDTPGSKDSRLSSHSPDGARGFFGVHIPGARSDDFATYAQAAVPVASSTGGPTTSGGSGATGTTGGVAATGTKPSGAKERKSGVLGLAFAGVVAAMWAMI